MRGFCGANGFIGRRYLDVALDVRVRLSAYSIGASLDDMDLGIRGKNSLLATILTVCLIKPVAQGSTGHGKVTPVHYIERKRDINKGRNTTFIERSLQELWPVRYTPAIARLHFAASPIRKPVFHIMPSHANTHSSSYVASVCSTRGLLTG